MHVLSRYSRWFCPFDSYNTWEIVHISSEIDCNVINVTRSRFGIFLSQSQNCSCLQHKFLQKFMIKGQIQQTEYSGKSSINKLWLKLNGSHLYNYIFKFIFQLKLWHFILNLSPSVPKGQNDNESVIGLDYLYSILFSILENTWSRGHGFNDISFNWHVLLTFVFAKSKQNSKKVSCLSLYNR